MLWKFNLKFHWNVVSASEMGSTYKKAIKVFCNWRHFELEERLEFQKAYLLESDGEVFTGPF